MCLHPLLYLHLFLKLSFSLSVSLAMTIPSTIPTGVPVPASEVLSMSVVTINYRFISPCPYLSVSVCTFSSTCTLYIRIHLYISVSRHSPHAHGYLHLSSVTRSPPMSWMEFPCGVGLGEGSCMQPTSVYVTCHVTCQHADSLRPPPRLSPPRVPACCHCQGPVS